MSQNPPVIHRNVALMLCDSSAVLTETLHQLEIEDIPFTRLGDRGFVAPAYYVAKIRKRLQEKAIYPAVTGDVLSHHPNEHSEDELDEDEGFDDTSEEQEKEQNNDEQANRDDLKERQSG